MSQRIIISFEPSPPFLAIAIGLVQTSPKTTYQKEQQIIATPMTKI